MSLSRIPASYLVCDSRKPDMRDIPEISCTNYGKIPPKLQGAVSNSDYESFVDLYTDIQTPGSRLYNIRNDCDINYNPFGGTNIDLRQALLDSDIHVVTDYCYLSSEQGGSGLDEYPGGIGKSTAVFVPSKPIEFPGPTPLPDIIEELENPDDIPIYWGTYDVPNIPEYHNFIKFFWPADLSTEIEAFARASLTVVRYDVSEEEIHWSFELVNDIPHSEEDWGKVYGMSLYSDEGETVPLEETTRGWHYIHDLIRTQGSIEVGTPVTNPASSTNHPIQLVGDVLDRLDGEEIDPSQTPTDPKYYGFGGPDNVRGFWYLPTGVDSIQNTEDPTSARPFLSLVNDEDSPTDWSWYGIDSTAKGYNAFVEVEVLSEIEVTSTSITFKKKKIRVASSTDSELDDEVITLTDCPET